MAYVYQTDNPSNNYEFDTLDVDEFLPIIRFKNPSRYVVEDEELIPSEEDVTLSEHLDNDKQTFTILQLTTNKEKIKLPFTIKKGINFFSLFEQDDDGYIEPKLSVEDDTFKITSELKNLKKYDTEIEVEIELKGTETTEFYLDFYANDNEDYFKGEYINVHCGRIKIIYKIPNEWEFSKEKIDKIKVYAVANNAKFSTATKYSDYHHCTDTHKHIIYKLLDNPSSLILGKDQLVGRDTPKDYEKAGESTTHGVRNKTIAATFAEPSKTFTVVDVNNNEVLTSSGQPGNTDNALKSFKESPVDYMKSKCPDNGYYVFIGAYNDDYHSFTIIVNKEDEDFKFQFVDQIVGVEKLTSKEIENEFLGTVHAWRDNYPMKLEIYQLRNKKK